MQEMSLHISSMHQYIVNHCIEIVYSNIFLVLRKPFFSLEEKQQQQISDHIRQFCSSVLFPQSLSPSHLHERGIHRSPQSN